MKMVSGSVGWGRLLGVALAFWLLPLSGCGKSLPDPVERKNGVARIPIDGLVFVIPEKSWLRGYSRNSTDGSVYGFTLHAAAPDVEPWSPANDARMYKVPGWGTLIEVMVSSNRGVKLVDQTEEWMEQHYPGCRFAPSSSFKEPNIRFCETRLDRFYGYVENNHFRYRLRCHGTEVNEKARKKFVIDPECHIYFPYRDRLFVDTVFAERYLPHAFEIARKVEGQLQQFDKTPAEPAQGAKK
jgi:hypothetical protein